MNLNSENIDQLMTALAKAQGQIQGASKDKLNPHFRSKYADLASIWEACRESLSKNQLGITQATITNEQGHLILVTTLGHSSGQWMRSYMPVLMQRQDAQGMGSALTYARRFSLAAMVGVAPEDDDGEGAGRNENGNVKPLDMQKSTIPKPPVKIVKAGISQEQAKELKETIGDDENYKNLLKSFFLKKGITLNSYSDIPIEYWEETIVAARENRRRQDPDTYLEASGG